MKSVKEQVYYQVRDKVGIQIALQTSTDDYNQVWNQISGQIWDQAQPQVWGQVQQEITK